MKNAQALADLTTSLETRADQLAADLRRLSHFAGDQYRCVQIMRDAERLADAINLLRRDFDREAGE